MEGKSRRVKKIREILPFDDEGSDDPDPSSPSRRPPAAVGGRAAQAGGLPPPPSFGPPPSGPPKLPTRAKAAFQEAGPPPSRAPRRGRPRPRGGGKRVRTRALAKTATGLESDDSSEEEAPASRSTGSKQAPPQASQAEEEAPGFFQSLWNGAAAAIGVVSDIVTAINAETDSEDEKQQASSKESKEGKSSEAEAKDKEKSSKTSAEEEEQYVEYVSQFCVYLGVDATAEPDLITEVDDYLRRPLPAGWTSHQTGEDCEYGSGYTYFMQAATGRTQWTRPDEDEFLQYLRKKMRRKPAAGSRLFFAALRDRNRRERWAALEDQIDHLSGARPLLRALPEGSPEPAPPNRSENLEDPCIFHVVLHKRFPVMAPAVVEAFASYFGLGALTQLTAAELRHVWVAKVAALCPVPTGWEFKFDETSLTAVFVDQAANVASRHHPMDAFFAGLLERLLSRHRSVEAAESQRSAEPVALGSQMVFYLDSRNGAPYWLQYGTGKPWQGTLPWKHKKSHQAPPPKPRPLSAKLQPPTPDAGSRAGGGVGLRDAANVPGRFDLSLRAAATQGPGGAPPQPVPKTPQPPPTPPSLTPKQDDTDVDAVGVASAEASEDGSEAADDASCTVESAEVKEDAARRPSSHEVPASRTSEASEDGEVLPSEPQVEPVAAAVDERAEGPGDVPDPSTPSGGPPLADEGAVATATETEPVADPPETTDVSQEQEGSPEQLRPAEELEPQETQVPRGPQKPQEPLEAESTAIEETAPPPPETAEPPEPPGPAPAPPPEETTEEAEGTESSKAQELPFLPSDAAEAGKKALAPHWSQRGGKWQTRGSRLSSDEEGELDDDEEAQRRKIERAQRAAERRAKSGKLKDAVARFQSDEESQGPAGLRLSPRSATLFRLAGELQTAPASDAPTLLGILQELERLPATVDLLRQTQLGVITQPFKDHGDPEVRALAKRLRRTWKDLIATAAGEAAAAMPPALPPPETEAASAASAVLSREPHHGMAPLMPGLEQEAEELLQELEEATSPERRPDPGVRTAKVGGTDDADEVFGPTPRHEPNDHVGSPHRRPRPKAAPKASAVADADEVFGTTPRQGASGYHAEQPPSASVPSEAKKPKFAALPKMPVQAKASVQPAQGEVPDPSSVPAPTPVSVDEASATPLPDISEDSSQAQERQGAPAALKSALPRAPVPTEPATASEPSAETAGYQEVAREAPAALKAPLPKAPLPKAPLPKAPLPEVQQSEAPAPPTPHDTPQAAAPAPPTPHDTAWAAAPAPPTPHDTARAAAPAPPTPHDTARAAAPAPPTPHDTTEELFEAPAADSHKKEQRATAPVPDTTPTMPVPAAATATPAAPTPAMPEAQKPAPSEKPKFAPLPAVPKLPPKPAPQPPKPAVPEASEQSSEDELIPATPQGPPEEVAAPQPPLPKGPMPSAGYPKKAAPPQAPGPRVNAGLPAAARRQRMELVSNLQWLCRLFLETREQLFAAHEGTETEANCEGLREELDAVLFRRLLEETLTLPETAASPKSLIRLLRSFGRRALYGRRRSVYGRRAHLHFQQACAAKGGPRAFVLGAVPKILQLMSRLVDEGHASMDDAVEDGGDDPWLGSGTAGDDRAATSPKAHGGLPDWETLEGILSEPKDLQSLQDEADAFLAEAAKPLPAPLRLTEADRAPLSAEAPNSGSFAPRGRRAAPGAGKASADGAANSRRIPAQKPFYSTEPSLLLKVAKAPLPNLDQLVACLVPGAEITTEGLLLQLADDDLVIVAYALQQIEEAASKRLIKELEVRDELRSTCMHRREYLQLLEGALTQGQA